MDRSTEIYQALHKMGIPHKRLEHRPMLTIEDCLALDDISLDGATMPRNIFLCNRQQTAFYLLLFSPRRAFRTAVVSKLLGVSRLSFAKEEHLRGLLGLDPGAVSPLGLVFDTDKQVTLVVDSALLKHEHLWFHPGVNTQSVRLRTEDFLRGFLPGIGREAVMIEIPDGDANPDESPKPV